MDFDCVKRAPRECCRTPGNVPIVENHPDAKPDRGLVVRVCKVCGARHFELTADPGQLGMRGAAIGG